MDNRHKFSNNLRVSCILPMNKKVCNCANKRISRKARDTMKYTMGGIKWRAPTNQKSVAKPNNTTFGVDGCYGFINRKQCLSSMFLICFDWFRLLAWLKL